MALIAGFGRAAAEGRLGCGVGTLFNGCFDFNSWLVEAVEDCEVAAGASFGAVGSEMELAVPVACKLLF